MPKEPLEAVRLGAPRESTPLGRPTLYTAKNIWAASWCDKEEVRQTARVKYLGGGGVLGGGGFVR